MQRQDVTGDSALPNGFAGITIFDGATDNTIGGAGAGVGNHISGNQTYGVVIGDGGTAGNVVGGNAIGIGVGGGALGNGFTALAIWNGATGNTIGGTAAGAGNRIANNGSNGIALFDPAVTFGNTFAGNSISAHSFKGINLGGGNRAQPAPQLGEATLDASGTRVTGVLEGRAGARLRVEFFANGPGGAPAEGEWYLGGLEVDVDGEGAAPLAAALIPTVSPGRTVTATATDLATGDTSEFSNAVAVVAVDSDGDGMPDDYETQNGLDKDFDDAQLDADGDGVSNLDEFHARTDPGSPLDFFGAISLALSGDGLVATFASVAGNVYRVERSSTLDPADWRVLVSFVVAEDSTFSIVDPGAAGGARVFYRAVPVP